MKASAADWRASSRARVARSVPPGLAVAKQYAEPVPVSAARCDVGRMWRNTGQAWANGLGPGPLAARPHTGDGTSLRCRAYPNIPATRPDAGLSAMRNGTARSTAGRNSCTRMSGEGLRQSAAMTPTIADCVFYVSNVMDGVAGIVCGNRILWRISGDSIWVFRRWRRFWPSCGKGSARVNGTCTPIIRSRLNSDRTCGWISTICGRDATRAIARKPCESRSTRSGITVVGRFDATGG
jgi:hypothetical protein